MMIKSKFIGILLWTAMALFFWQAGAHLAWSQCNVTLPEACIADMTMEVSTAEFLCKDDPLPLRFNSYFEVTLSGVPDGYFVTDGIFPGWCLESDRLIYTGHQYQISTYSSLSPPAFLNIPLNTWNKVNTLLNIKGETPWFIVQLSMWALVSDDTSIIDDPKSVLGRKFPYDCPKVLTDEAKAAAHELFDRANNPQNNVVPGPGKKFAVILLPVDPYNCPKRLDMTQLVIIEATCPATDCALEVTKTCFLPSPPSGVFECDKPINVLTMIWYGTEAVRIKAWKGAVGSTLLANVDNITVGDEVTVSGFAGSPNDVIWEVFEAGTSVKIGESTFHLSCSDDDMNGLEDCGMRQGNGKDKSGFINDWLLEGMVDAKNSFDCTVDPISPGADECVFFTQEETLCEKRPTAISLRYTGGDCSQTSHNQDPGKVSCTDFPPLVEPVWIVISKPDGTNVSLDTGGAVVKFGDIVTATAANAGRSEFDSESLVQVFDENNDLLQELVFHTSCSQPLAPGDQFGSVKVVGFENADQGQVQLGVEVEYTYEIKNMGDVELFNLTVEDSVLGTVPGSPIASLGLEETTTLTATAFIEETTTNFVTVTWVNEFDDQCSATDWSTVTAVGPPPCIVSPVEFKISDDKIEWKLSNDGNKVVTIDSIEVSWPDTLGHLKKVKREGDTIFEGRPVPQPLALITSDMMTSDIKKRQIKHGESKKVKFEFAAKASTVPEDYEITVYFAEDCFVTFEPESIPFVCRDAKPIETLTLIWIGALPVTVTSESGQSFDITDDTEREVTFDVLGLGNDVDVDISGAVNGKSRFHVSCSDNEMNGPEDCGNPQGNSKDNNSGRLNLWTFEGMAGNGLTLDCTP